MPEVKFAPFQRVLVRDNDNDGWHTDFFSNISKYEPRVYYHTVGGFYRQCIPYEGNERLLGTTDSPTPPEPEFKWGDHVEVREFLDNDWQPAIFCSHGPNCFLCVTKSSAVVHGWRYCRHADW